MDAKENERVAKVLTDHLLDQICDKACTILSETGNTAKVEIDWDKAEATLVAGIQDLVDDQIKLQAVRAALEGGA